MKRLAKAPSAYFRDNFWITTSGMMTEPPLRFALELCGADRTMFAVDYPYEQTAEAVAFIRAVPLDAATMRRVAHANAEALFRIAPAGD